jgi:hypothetical protein
MNRLSRAFLAAALTSLATHASLATNKTFLPHRDELSYTFLTSGPRKNFLHDDTSSSYGVTCTATPIYHESTNKKQTGALFGMNGASQLTVTLSDPEALDASTSYNDGYPLTKLYSFNLDHAPNASTAPADTNQHPLSGILSLAPERRVYGAYFHIDKSLNTLAPGLSLSLVTPLVNVGTRMNAVDETGRYSNIPATDGQSGALLKDYFSGNHEKHADHVTQKGLKRAKITDTYNNYFGLADVEAHLRYQLASFKKASLSVGAVMQIPTGTRPTNEYLFEPIAGNRGHLGLGLSSEASIHGFVGKAYSFDVVASADWRYFFSATEKRFLTIANIQRNGDNQFVAPHYRLGMQHQNAGVFPLANVLSVDHSITPGHQVTLTASSALSWKSFTGSIGYSMYWHQAEKAQLKTGNEWPKDTYALAHQRYSTYNKALGNYIIGGTTTTNDGDKVLSGFATDAGDYDDLKSPLQKHKNKIGAYNDSNLANEATFIDTDTIAGGAAYPGAFTSFFGPIQPEGTTTSSLRTQATGIDADAGVTSDDEDPVGTLAVFYQTQVATPLESQLTHSFFADIQYTFGGKQPVFVGLGGQIELQDAQRNSALETISVWLKVGTSF